MCAEFIALNHQLMALLVTRLPKQKIRKPLFFSYSVVQEDKIAITGNDSYCCACYGHSSFFFPLFACIL